MNIRQIIFLQKKFFASHCHGVMRKACIPLKKRSKKAIIYMISEETRHEITPLCKQIDGKS